MIYLETRSARLAVDEEAGARLASLRIEGLEILVREAEDPLAWGAYPMAPWASRVRDGFFEFEGRRFELPRRMPPHAIHGTVLDRPWVVSSSDATTCLLETRLGPAWPWTGVARQSYSLTEAGLDGRLEIHADDAAFPASLGWHPWFLRRLERGAPLELDFEAGAVYCTDAAGLPTGATASPGPGPFDDCFKDVLRDPVIRWPGALELTLSTTLDHWIVYSRPEHAICVEPVSAPPDSLNRSPRIVSPDRPLIGEFSWRWIAA